MAAAAISAPVPDERPASYADRIGSEVVGRKSTHRKEIGIYLTPVEVADFVAGAFENDRSSMRILDPAGSGTLICALVEALARRSEPIRPRDMELVAYEIDGELAEALRVAINYLTRWAALRKISL